jgi:predicted nuclease of restriction endonuclease-like (RecB) superfamily
MEIKLYADLLSDIKKRIKTAQVKAAFTANAHLIALYWDIGQMIAERQKQQGWAASVIPKLSIDLKNELAEMSGFSERNLGRMVSFCKAYQSGGDSILQQPVAKLPNSHLLLAIPWGHHALLIEKIKDRDIRFWYMSQTLEQGWSRDTLRQMIKNDSYNRQGVLNHNFDRTLPVEFSELVQQMLKDPYVFDFFTLTSTFTEREFTKKKNKTKL